MHVEGIWSDNEHTAKGTILHKNADERGYEIIGQAKCLHALPLYSEIYGLNGKADIVEIRKDEIIPVEYKKGKKREFDNDLDAQYIPSSSRSASVEFTDRASRRGRKFRLA